MRILIVSDAWSPQINGVVITLRNTIRELEIAGHTVATITPEGFKSIPCPTYPEIRLALFPRRRVARRIDLFMPDAIHIATEGPLGPAAPAAIACVLAIVLHRLSHAVSEHVYARIRLPVGICYRWMRWFHAPASALMVATPTFMTARGSWLCEPGDVVAWR